MKGNLLSPLVFGYLSAPKLWMRAALVGAAVPLAILANAVRVAAVGWIPSLDSEGPHAIAGSFIFVLCVGTLLVLRRVLEKAYES